MPTDNIYNMYVLIFFLGGLSLSIYSLALAHTNDHLEKEQIMSASATMILINGVGAALSPLIVASAMDFISVSAFFGTITMISLSMFVFALYRMSTAQSIPPKEQGTYIITPMRTSSTMAASLMKEQNIEPSIEK